MAVGRSSFTKRQKEQARAQKRADKEEKKRQKGTDEKSGIGANDDFEITEDGQIRYINPVEPEEQQ